MVFSIEIRQIDIIKLLSKDKNVDVNFNESNENNEFQPPAIIAAINPYYINPIDEIVKLLLDRTDLDYNVKDNKNYIYIIFN